MLEQPMHISAWNQLQESIADSENEARRAYIPDYLDKKGRMVFVTLPTIKVWSSFSWTRPIN
jgi:hypothetical protein